MISRGTRFRRVAPGRRRPGEVQSRRLAELEARLASSEALVGFLTEHSTDVIIHAGADRRIGYITRSCAALLHLEPAELIGVTLVELVHPDDRDIVDDAIRRAIDGGVPSRVQARCLQSASDAVAWVEVTVQAVLVPVEPYELEFHVTLHDIAERLAANAALAEAEERFRSISEGTPDVIYRLQLDTLTFEYVNAAITLQTGRTPEEVSGDPGAIVDLVHPDDLSTLNAYLSGDSTAVVENRVQMRWVHADGHSTWAEHQVRLQRDRQGRPLLLDGIARDITAIKRNEQELRDLAHSDALTGLPNRRAVLGILERRIADGQPVVALFIDLDGFKSVNDTLGHEAGDELLVAVARRLEGAKRSEDVVARLAGDEFLVLTSLQGARPLSGRIVDELIWPFELKAGTARISASIGTATAERGEDPDAVLRRADTGMYEAKHQSRGSNRRSWVHRAEEDATRQADDASPASPR